MIHSFVLGMRGARLIEVMEKLLNGNVGNRLGGEGSDWQLANANRVCEDEAQTDASRRF